MAVVAVLSVVMFGGIRMAYEHYGSVNGYLALALLLAAVVFMLRWLRR